MKFDVIIIGGGHAGSRVACGLQDSGLKCAVITSGRSIHGSALAQFEKKGGMVLADDEITNTCIQDSKLVSVKTEKLGDVVLEAANFVIATGKFFSKGLVSDMKKVWEPIFGLDVEYSEDRTTWYTDNFADHQPFLDFGVKVDETSKPSIEGKTVNNLYAVGELLAGVSCAEKDDLAAVDATADKVIDIIKAQ